MSTHIRITDSSFFLDKKNDDAAFKALRSTKEFNNNYWEEEGLLDTQDVLERLNFTVETTCPAIVEQHKVDAICNLKYSGYGRIDGSNQHFPFFEALAPFVREGSWICWMTEYGEEARWYFVDGRVVVERVVEKVWGRASRNLLD